MTVTELEINDETITIKPNLDSCTCQQPSLDTISIPANKLYTEQDMEEFEEGWTLDFYLVPVRIFATEFTESSEVKVHFSDFSFSSMAFSDRFLDICRSCSGVVGMWS